LVLIGAMALAAFLLAFGLVLPTRNRAAELARTEQRLSAKIAQATSMYAESLREAEEIVGLQAELQEVMFPDKDASIAVVRQIDQLASEFDLRITSIRPGEVGPMSGSIRHPVTVTVESDFPGIVRLLYELERPQRRLWVEGVEMTLSRQESGGIQANVHVAVYLQPPDGEEDASA
jgi:hypothetical protein